MATFGRLVKSLNRLMPWRIWFFDYGSVSLMEVGCTIGHLRGSFLWEKTSFLG
jgi:hypothetical protein